MSLQTEDVKKIAKLARIRLTEEETKEFSTELSSILDWVDQLQEVDTDNVPQMASVSQQDLPLRKDEVTSGGYPDRILSNAPKAAYDCFEVPKVIEDE